MSNVSFSYRGNDVVREAMNAAFLYHAIHAGLDMGIVNPGQLEVYEEIPRPTARARRGRLLNRRPDAADRLTEFAETVKSSQKKDTVDATRPGGGSRRRAAQARPDQRAPSITSSRTSRKPAALRPAAGSSSRVR